MSAKVSGLVTLLMKASLLMMWLRKRSGFVKVLMIVRVAEVVAQAKAEFYLRTPGN
jgi:hypothetical protein